AMAVLVRIPDEDGAGGQVGRWAGGVRSTGSMKILFLARRYSYYRNYDSVIRSLAARGHVLHLAVDRENAEGLPLIQRLAAASPNITYEELPPKAGDAWTWL